MEKTTNYKLPRWEKDDFVKMDDFNAAFQTIDETLKNSFYRDPRIEAEISVLEGQVLDDKISSFIAAKRLLDLYFGGKAE